MVDSQINTWGHVVGVQDPDSIDEQVEVLCPARDVRCCFLQTQIGRVKQMQRKSWDATTEAVLECLFGVGLGIKARVTCGKKRQLR